MKTKGQAFFHGYILILFASMVFRIICILFDNIDFPFWNRIVTAATVSTCVFCISDFFTVKNEIKKYRKLQIELQSMKQINTGEKYLTIIENDLKKRGYETEEEREKKISQLFKELNETVREDHSLVETAEVSNGEFIWNVIGFFSFFAIIILDPVYQTIMPFQDLLTLLAFIIVFIVSTYKEKRMNQLNFEIQKYMISHGKLEVARIILELVSLAKNNKSISRENESREQVQNGKDENGNP